MCVWQLDMCESAGQRASMHDCIIMEGCLHVCRENRWACKRYTAPLGGRGEMSRSAVEDPPSHVRSVPAQSKAFHPRHFILHSITHKGVQAK